MVKFVNLKCTNILKLLTKITKEFFAIKALATSSSCLRSTANVIIAFQYYAAPCSVKVSLNRLETNVIYAPF